MPLFDEIKEHLTIACCKRCERSSDVRVFDNKLWCAWCCKECEVFHKSVEVVSKEKFESLHTNLDGQFIDPKNLKLQPLRITSGWKVAMRNAFFEIDPTPESVKDEFVFNCTMLVLEHEGKNRLLDVGWSDEMNFETGEYYLNLYEGGYGGTVIRSYRGKDRLELVREIETILEEVTNRMPLFK